MAHGLPQVGITMVSWIIRPLQPPTRLRRPEQSYTMTMPGPAVSEMITAYLSACVSRCLRIVMKKRHTIVNVLYADTIEESLP